MCHDSRYRAVHRLYPNTKRTKTFRMNYFYTKLNLPDEKVSRASEGSHDFHKSVICLYMIGSELGLSVWPSTGITVKVLKYCLNSVVDLANASTVLMADVLAIESLKTIKTCSEITEGTLSDGRRTTEEKTKQEALKNTLGCIN